jgi:hypothetical protein
MQTMILLEPTIFMVIFELFMTALVYPVSENIGPNMIDEPSRIIEVTQDSGFNCGSKYWGIRDFQNFHSSDNKNIFGKQADCTDSLGGSNIQFQKAKRNYIELTSRNKANDDFEISIQSTLQGTTPWGFSSKDDGGASLSNEMLPLPTDLDYQLEAEYIWLDDDISRPNKKNADVNINVDLWFADTNSPRTEDGQYRNIVGVDFNFAKLESDGNRWVHNNDTIEGSPYYEPFAKRNRDNGQTTYLFNTVLDTDGEQPGQWYAPSPTTYKKTIKQFIDDAFNYEYKTEGGEKVDKPIRSDYKLIEVEAVAEVTVGGDKEADATVTAGFSKVKLAYQK